MLIHTLWAILDGSRDPALADNPDLNYGDAVEVRLLLETLPSGPAPPEAPKTSGQGLNS